MLASGLMAKQIPFTETALHSVNLIEDKIPQTKFL